MKENEKIRKWRERNGWSHERLGELTGWTAKSIYWYERGQTPKGNPTPPWVLHRFRMACAGVEATMASGRFFGPKGFDWS